MIYWDYNFSLLRLFLELEERVDKGYYYENDEL